MVFDNLSEESKQKVMAFEPNGPEITNVVIDRNVHEETNKFVLIETIKYKKNNNPRYYFIIQCKDCGCIKKTDKSHFKNSTVCEQCKAIKNRNDFIGFENQTYKVIGFSHINKVRKLFYTVECKNCGHIGVVRKDNILGATKPICINCKGNGVIPSIKSTINVYESHYMDGAKARGLIYELTSEQFNTLINGQCFYCGEAPKERKSLKRYNFTGNKLLVNGIDRLDPNLGYTIDNCVPCCSICNRMKSDLCFTDFVQKIEQIHKYHKSSTTISKESTSEANADGKGRIPDEGI